MDEVTCSTVLDQVEPIAAGELEAGQATRAHLERCVRCASALALARRIDELLAGREAPAAPPGFTEAVLARARRERWVAEQRVDFIFNTAVALAAVALVVVAAAVVNLERVLPIATAAWELVQESVRRGEAASDPSLLTWAGAVAFMGLALGLWWWGEQRLSH